MRFFLEKKGRFLLVRFSYDSEAYEFVRRIPKAKWDPVRKNWVLPFSEANLDVFLKLDSSKVVLKGELELRGWIKTLRLKNSSRRTIQAYYSNVLSLLKWSGKNPREIEKKDVLTFLEVSFLEKKLSATSVSLRIQALNSYFGFYLGKPWFKNLPRPKREQKLPNILSPGEVSNILKALPNPKHRLLLSFCYASGLRVSELVKLKPEDIDETRKSLKIREGKGKKDRFTMLSQACASLWKEFREANPYEEWVFPGQDPSKPIHIRTAEKIFEMAREKAGIKKPVSIHGLRHAFATHLLEAGTNIKHIQFLLGHKSVRTTEIYTQVSQVRLTEVASPLDLLNLKKN
ncbi:tyrosine-type recombinase/integrase [Leptospira sp. 201903070]|uniref:Tyrosine-type recombinase/integrase n=1 Tax=Leptospira ainlahdjerensis TaxID=2810033 RepID=A0ABS2UDZ1_9LEPT|nr:tyrosine-type recombinase/integrase [Leptospira ainlahdjerensis]MBM9578173.1 tyrosine-type recombinase/integrase [Leptospira ainlahdjerensis]